MCFITCPELYQDTTAFTMTQPYSPTRASACVSTPGGRGPMDGLKLRNFQPCDGRVPAQAVPTMYIWTLDTAHAVHVFHEDEDEDEDQAEDQADEVSSKSEEELPSHVLVEVASRISGANSATA